MEFKEIVSKRYACKKFSEKKISDKKIDELLEIIRLTPSSLNFQPWKIKIVDNQETKNKLFPETNNQIQATTCSHLLVFCVDTNFEEKAEKLKELKLKESKNKKISEKSIQKKLAQNEEQKFNWAEKQIYLALGNALNGAKSLGLDACPIGGFSPKGYTRVLNLPNNIIPVIVCALGFADDVPKKKIRFSKEEIFF